MQTAARDTILRLQKEILPLQGYRKAASVPGNIGLKQVEAAFPNKSFPTASMHEFLVTDAPGRASSSGFIAGLLNKLDPNGLNVWIGGSEVFPPALTQFNIKPEQVVFIRPSNEREALWAMEEVLKCQSITAVVGEVQDISFTASRRLQLAVESSGVTGFVLRRPAKAPMASVARWRIVPMKTQTTLPGPGFPRWNVELLKVRSGTPGAWEVEWANGAFRMIPAEEHESKVIHLEQRRKTG